MVSFEEQLKYIYNLKNIYIFSKEEYDKLIKNIYSLYVYFIDFINNNKLSDCINYNKLSDTLIKFRYCNDNYLNNLPLNLKYLACDIVNCNLSPNIIYLECYYCDYCDFNNLPRSLQFIYYINKNKIPQELIEHNYNYNNINFIKYNYIKIIKLNSIY